MTGDRKDSNPLTEKGERRKGLFSRSHRTFTSSALAHPATTSNEVNQPMTEMGSSRVMGELRKMMEMMEMMVTLQKQMEVGNEDDWK